MIPIAIAAVVLILDILTKYWVHAHLPLMNSFPIYPYGGIGIFEDWGGIQFSITHLINRGAAWGVLSGYQDLLVLARIVMIAGLFLYCIFGKVRKSWKIPLALILAGAVGNVIDFYVYGHVVDMFYFIFWGYSYPVFNVADSAVTIGVVWLVILNLFEHRQNEVSV